MIASDALAGSGLFALFAVVPVCCVLAGLGRRGFVAAVLILAVTVAANLVIAFSVREYGDFGFAVVAVSGVLASILVLISQRIGVYIREQRSAPGKR